MTIYKGGQKVKKGWNRPKQWAILNKPQKEKNAGGGEGWETTRVDKEPQFNGV